MWFVVVTLLSASLHAVLAAQGSVISCPRCTDPYDPTSCTQTIMCHNSHDICELYVHLADRNRVEYACHNSHACTNHEAHACSEAGHEACSHCCRSIDSCKQQREELFSTIYTTMPPTTTAATQPSTMDTSTVPATTAPLMTTTPPPMTTAAVMTTTNVIPSSSTTMPPMAGNSSSTPGAEMCIQCSGQPCTTLELLSSPPTVCPAATPYCYTSLVQNLTDVAFIKGCADSNFCKREWWDMTSTHPECLNPDVSNGNNVLTCTYCCQGPSCNTAIRPADSTLLNFQ